jgi:hypothetical protein
VNGHAELRQSVSVRAVEAQTAFEEFLVARGIRPSTLDAASAVDAVIEFYVNVRADDLRPDDDDAFLQLHLTLHLK